MLLFFLQNATADLIPDLKNTLTFLQNFFIILPPFSSLSTKDAIQERNFESRSFFKSLTNLLLKRVPSTRFRQVQRSHVLFSLSAHVAVMQDRTKNTGPGLYLRCHLPNITVHVSFSGWLYLLLKQFLL